MASLQTGVATGAYTSAVSTTPTNISAQSIEPPRSLWNFRDRAYVAYPEVSMEERFMVDRSRERVTASREDVGVLVDVRTSMDYQNTMGTVYELGYRFENGETETQRVSMASGVRSYAEFPQTATRTRRDDGISPKEVAALVKRYISEKLTIATSLVKTDTTVESTIILSWDGKEFSRSEDFIEIDFNENTD